MSLVNLYLVLYNITAALLWTATFILAANHILTVGVADYYAVIEDALKLAQTLAVMEIVHSAVGIVRSPLMSTTMQVFSRLFLLWGILHPVEEAQHGIAVILMTLSWSIVEIPRYTFYALNLMNAVPYILKWLRYSMFAVLYPTGIAGELLCMKAALPYLASSNLWSVSMPNRMNFPFSYYYLVLLIGASYLPGGPFMYSHMLKQRRRALVDTNKSKSQ